MADICGRKLGSMQDIEPFYGWLNLYDHHTDELSPFHGVEHSEFYYDRAVYNYLAHPLWDSIESESLLVKILFADYDKGYAIIELFGVWNDLLQNDFGLLRQNCLEPMMENGIQQFIFICENVLHVYVEEDDYYQAMAEDLEDGWMCLLRTREHVREDLREYNLDQYFFWAPELDTLQWRKLKPWQIWGLIQEKMSKMLPGA